MKRADIVALLAILLIARVPVVAKSEARPSGICRIMQLRRFYHRNLMLGLPSAERRRQAYIATPGVSDRNPHSEEVVGVELGVVDDVIPMGFGAGKEIAPEVIPDTRASMKQQVGAVEVGNAAAGNQIAIAKFVVEEHMSARPRQP